MTQSELVIMCLVYCYVCVGSNLLKVAIATPVGVAICVVVLVLVVVIVVLAWRHHRRSGQYEFHRLTFSDVKEEET